ncbi:hypothetical protein L1887_02458 [Cichorium endivia]|nr:hypothetical protein L1887_02458 [Cichorium endivia]
MFFLNSVQSQIREVQESQTLNPAVHFCIYKYGVAKEEHSFAGMSVSLCLCLHPMDTVKTVIQSCHIDQRSISYIGKSILSERGLSGLYRRITSNIASSAPISAIYNFRASSVSSLSSWRLCEFCHFSCFYSKGTNKAADASWGTLSQLLKCLLGDY